MSFFIEKVDDYYTLTRAGYFMVAIILVGVIVLGAFLFDKRNAKTGAKELAFTAMALALAFALSYVKVFAMPWGGSVTLCSMLFVCIIGYFYGPKMGLMAGLAYGMLQFLQDGGGYILSPMQVCCDYFFAFMALGVSGFFYKAKRGLLVGYIVGIIARGLFASLAGYLYWMEYMPDSFPSSLAAVYPIAYNYSYIFAEGLITIIILLIPGVSKAVERVRKSAN